ncbi:MAG: hypothetical protein DIZ78_09850 [endosymbiont of Escarpia spicata]|uniref:Glycosyltransferase 2-like domain-containing protein n=1 Tax=endosymbiont of Escarpia spicata TaxID=2200908 RepID=A0A370DNJ8_9GAMM|nr:MAG: hypothetical protein DIZ78_09850 [endosymbiont of Escarpia spicata]
MKTLTQQIKLQANTLYLIKLSVVRKISESPSEVIVNVQTSFSVTDEQVSVNDGFDFNMPTSSKILDERADLNEWYEQSVFIYASEFINSLIIASDESDQHCVLIVRETPVVVKPTEKNTMIASFKKMENVKLKRNGIEYSVFLNVSDAYRYIEEVVDRLNDVPHPILRIRHKDFCNNFPPLTIGLIGDDPFYGMLETTLQTIKIGSENIELILNDFFDVILIQNRSSKLLPFGSTTDDEKRLLASLTEALRGTKTPIIKLNSPKKHNSLESTLHPLKNCFRQETVTAFEYEVCNFSPVKSNNSKLMTIVVPVATDLYQFPLFKKATEDLVGFGFKISLFEANHGHVPLRTWEKFNSRNVKVYQKLAPKEIAVISGSSGFMLLTSNTHRSNQDLCNLCSIAITSGAIPVIFGKPLPSPFDSLTKNFYSVSELYDFIIEHSKTLSREKYWLAIFRRFKGLQRKGCFIDTIYSISSGQQAVSKYNDFPSAEMICVSKRVDNLENILATFDRQTYTNVTMHLVLSVSDYEKDACEAIKKKYENERFKVSILDQSQNIGNCLNYAIRSSEAGYWFKIDNNDYYGKYYIEDMLNWYDVTDADVVGKPSALVYLSQSDETYLREHAEDQMRTFLHQGSCLCGATLSGRSDRNLPMFSSSYENSCDSKWLEVLIEQEYKVFSSDIFNFTAHKVDDSLMPYNIEDGKGEDKWTLLANSSLKGWANAD